MSTIRFTVSIPKPTYQEIKRAARDAQIKPADVVRQSIRLGLVKFVEQFPKPEATAVPAGK